MCHTLDRGATTEQRMRKCSRRILITVNCKWTCIQIIHFEEICFKKDHWPNKVKNVNKRCDTVFSVLGKSLMKLYQKRFVK